MPASRYNPDIFPAMVEQFCAEKGFKYTSVAKLFKVSPSTIKKWRDKCSLFRTAIQKGTEEYNLTVANKALVQRLSGYFYSEITKQINADGELETYRSVRRHVPPDIVALKFYLNNKDPQNWKERKDLTVNVLEHLSDAELDQRLRLVVDNIKKTKEHATG